MFRFLTLLAVNRWPAVLAVTLLFCAYAWHRFQGLPIEAFPDVTNPMVEIVGVYPGQAAEEVERRVTVELERVLAGTPRLADLRSVSVFGLSLVTMTFEENTSDFQLRTLVTERLRDAALPEHASVQMGPQATPVGQIYRYTLRGRRGLRDLRAIQDFVVERRLRSVPGVADVVTFGGYQRNYIVRIDPTRLATAHVSVTEVHEAIARSNDNAGGGYVGIGSQEFVVRGVGTLKQPSEIGSAVIRESKGVPLRVRDVAEITEGSTARRGVVGRGHNDEVVEGIVLLRRGENPSQVLRSLHERLDQLNNDILPKDVRISTFYDRTNLVSATLSTVGRNMIEGVGLVLIVVYLFLRTLRAVLIIAVVIPVSMLTAFLGLSLMGLPANLVSLGAIDFGILIDGAIIIVEATLHAIERHPDADHKLLIERAAIQVARPVMFSMLIIIVALTPIFSLEQVEGRIFAPMAYTYAFALLGALISAMVVVPALEAILMRGKIHAREPIWITGCRSVYLHALRLLNYFRLLILAGFGATVVYLGIFASQIGTEFLPELNEGGFYVTSVFPSTISLDETRGQVHKMRELILELPEVLDVLSHIGRPENATQAEGPNNAEFFVQLVPETQWRKGYNRRALEQELRNRMSRIPGAHHNFSQPITDRVFETISGIIGQVVVKVRGSDLDEMTKIAELVKERLDHVRGVTDLALYQSGDVPSIRIDLDRESLARRNLSISDVQTTIKVALGGVEATQIWEGERHYPVSLRLPDAVRSSSESLGRLTVGNAKDHVTLAEIARISLAQGRSSIWREDFTRFVAVKFNVRGRDLGSTVDEARAATADLQLPDGAYLAWGGEFQNQKRAMRRLSISLPVALAVILGMLYLSFNNWRPTLVIFLFLPVAIVGAVAGLRLLDENFSVSSAVGCIALIGQMVLSGVILCSSVDEARKEAREQALYHGAGEAFRPVMLTSALAAFGLVPAALSHSMGSETQRPFAISIVSGLAIGIPAVLFVMPLAYGLICGLAAPYPYRSKGSRNRDAKNASSESMPASARNGESEPRLTKPMEKHGIDGG